MDDGENAPGSFPLFFDFWISQNVEEARNDSGPNNALLRPFLQFGNRLKTLNWNVIYLDSTGLNFCFMECWSWWSLLRTYPRSRYLHVGFVTGTGNEGMDTHGPSDRIKTPAKFLLLNEPTTN
jgi:hypothetical protein